MEHHGHSQGGGTTDPVCGMAVDPATARNYADHQGRRYYFCGPRCREKFLADPARYLASQPPKAEDTEAIYTCPMHPEVRQKGPGHCPICGMALEPLTPGADGGANAELADMTRRFIAAAVLCLPLLALGMLGGMLGLDRLLAPRVSAYVQMAFAAPVVFWAGWPFLLRGWDSLKRRRLNMFSLIALGTLTAFFYSAAATLLPHLFPPALRGAQDAVAVYFEAAGVIVALVLLGQVLELKARARTSGAIRALLDLAPKTARRIGPDGESDVPVEAIAVGDLIRVRPGEAIATDGRVVEGRSAVDASMVTGESLPADKGPGDAVIGGTINRSGTLVVQAEKVGRDTMLTRIVEMVAEAQRSRAPIQNLADRVAAWFVPSVVAVAVLAFAAWMTLGPVPRLPFALVAAVSVLIIACPCALGLATPMSIMVGVGRGAQSGVLIKNAEALERMEAIDTLVLDKTGTLTEGKPSVTGIAASGIAETELLRLAAGVESASEHPLGVAIVAAAKAKGLAIPPVADFLSPAGKGAQGTVEGHRLLLGGARFLAENGIETGALAAQAEAAGRDGATAIFCALDGHAAGLFALADTVKPGVPAVLERLRQDGIRLVMLTGDNRATAAAIARQLGIDEVEAETLPDEKHAVIARLKGEGRKVAMAGDGVNDAPALAAADVGIAMGSGTDVAMQSAGVTLLGGDLAGIARARTLSKATMRNIRQNLLFAFGYNAIGIPVAAGVLYPAFGLLLSPMIAAAAMALSSVSVIGNALRLRWMRLG